MRAGALAQDVPERTHGGRAAQHAVVDAHDQDVGRPAVSSRGADDGLEDGLDVRGRARDRAQDLAGRLLLLERLGKIAVAGVHFPEQADVSDGNDGLVGKGLEERDLRIRE